VLHHINGAYTTYFNTKRKRSGHLFQGRYKAILVEKDSYCKELSRYIHLNPIRAGLADKASEYRWSSYPFYIRKEKRPAWLTTEFILGYFGKDESSAQKNYRKFVEDALESETKNPLKDVFASTFLGSLEFITWVKENFVGSKNVDTRNIPVLRELVEKPSLEQIEQDIVNNGKDKIELEKQKELLLIDYMAALEELVALGHENLEKELKRITDVRKELSRELYGALEESCKTHGKNHKQIRSSIDGIDNWQPFASGVSVIWAGLEPGIINALFHISWWLALGLILLFIPYFRLSTCSAVVVKKHYKASMKDCCSDLLFRC